VVATISWKAKGFVFGKDNIALLPVGVGVGGVGEDDLGVEWNTRLVLLLLLVME